MTDALPQFVCDTLKEWGAVSTELAPGVWRFQLPEGDVGQAARYLSRPSGELLLTFDMRRWEEGARIECLSPVSPLVRRLQMYAEGRGVYAAVTVPLDKAATASGYRHQPYLLARFSARYSSYRVVEDRHWLGLSLNTGEAVKVAGDPLGAEGMVEGEPDPDNRVAPKIEPPIALEKLVDLWEQQVSQRSRALVNESEAAYLAEAEEAQRVLDGDELEERIAMLAQRYAPTVESNLEAAILFWR